jgi:hypothetical protein
LLTKIVYYTKYYFIILFVCFVLSATTMPRPMFPIAKEGILFFYFGCSLSITAIVCVEKSAMNIAIIIRRGEGLKRYASKAQERASARGGAAGM